MIFESKGGERTMTDFIIIFIIACLVASSIAYRMHQKKKGVSSCGCNCEHCSSHCNKNTHN